VTVRRHFACLLTVASKTQLAIEYCYRLRERSPKYWVFWVHASSSTRLETSVREMTELLKLPGRDDSHSNIIQLFGNWLRCSTSQWLLVLDNADVEDVLFNSMDSGNNTTSMQDLKRPIDYLLVPTHGQTILTTRYQRVASRCLDACDVINVGPMDTIDAASLFRNRTEQIHTPVDIDKLAQALDYVPLAIAQAAAYTQNFVPPCSIAVYLAKLGETNKSDASLLRANFNELRRDPDSSNSIITTWQVSFEHIRKLRPSAADRLFLMSFFDHRGIPKTLLRMNDPIETAPPSESSGTLPSRLGLLLSGSEAQSNLASNVGSLAIEDTTEDIELERDISLLHDFHLLAVKVDTNELEMHPLVHLSARKWLESHGKRDEYMYKSMDTLDSALDIHPVDRMTEFMLQWKELYPHVQLALESRPRSEKVWSRQMNILEGARTFMSLQQRYPEAEVLSRRLRVECKHQLGDEHPATLRSESLFGRTLKALGKYEDALGIFEHVLGVAERKFEPDRSNKEFMFECLMPIGELEREIGSFAKAEVYLRRALECIADSTDECGQNRVVQSRVICTRSLVEVLLGQGKHQDAEDMCHQLLELCAHYGNDHRFRLASSLPLASLLPDEGRLDEASEVLQQGLKAVNLRAVVNHLDIWQATMSLASIFRQQKKMREVANLFQQFMENCVKVLGEEHPFTLESAETYAAALNVLGEHDKAIGVLRSCVIRSERVLGPDHEKTVLRTRRLMEWEQEFKEAEESQAARKVHDPQETKNVPKKQATRRKRNKCAVQ
jgi:tetratricopeptide (TPR) repeat protein